MILSRGGKRPIEILCKKLNGDVQPMHGYSAWACSGRSTHNFRESKSSFDSSYGNAHTAFGMFSRRYAVEVSASEQMNLIKQLRERTSAPIKDVKSSLVDCNRDIVSQMRMPHKRI